ncbi:nucleotidyltransferase [Fructilactobacillus fructivorans]|nr:nucleotidyltransferase [Fructilactobacillus fructivorans]KRK58557.1 hypothetical protein FC73_GL000112 [Fructilactobacillus fructivorans]KRN40111.1 hypothetical protein IV51_GL000292 [Fructilactobacillus fructivorans]KRN42538.1 hypothetical protein IV48_GL000186 [Fructilactobacillus fructivorans]
MMKAMGIISEYDPFHNGHLYQLQQAKQLTHPDATIVFMSGNWTQRGEPAIYDKWVRAQMALENGADLVIELPIVDAVQPASIFAQRAVNLVSSMKCSYLSFGSEHSDWDFMKLATVTIGKSNEFHDYRYTYPELFRRTVKKQSGIDLNQPNDTLAFWYAKANRQLSFPLKLIPIKRYASGHNSDKLAGKIASGKAIRSAIRSHDDSYQKFIPRSSVHIETEKPLFWSDFWPYLRYELTQSSLSDLGRIYQMREGLEYRLKQAAIKDQTYDSFMTDIKTKRYTYTRLQRLLVYTLFQMTETEMANSRQVIRVLGMNQNGRNYLNQVKKTVRFPIVDRIGKDAFNKTLEIECHSGILYGMLNGRIQDKFTHPIMI